MSVKCGIDIVKTERIESFCTEGRLNKMFTDAEIEYCRDGKGGYRKESLAARFAAKEAVLKALGTGFSDGMWLKSVEVECVRGQKPTIRLHGRAEKLYNEMHGIQADLSLTHDGDYAAAMVVICFKQDTEFD